MTKQQIVALFVISAFVIGLFAYAYFLGRKAGRAYRHPGLLFDSAPRAGHSRPFVQASPQSSISERSGHALGQTQTDSIPASPREIRSIDAQKTESLCCEAAGIIQPLSPASEALIPHDKLREAAPADATLIAKERSHAQPAEGYTHPSAVRCIVAVMDSVLTDKAGVYATSESMAQAIEVALQQAGFLMPTDKAFQALRDRLDELVASRETEQRKHHHIVTNLKRTITELEERIMSYTSMPVTRPDYDLLLSSAETLRLAEKTWKAAPGTEPWRNRATQQMQDIQALAMRVHAQLRTTPASAAAAGEAA
ncbi:hypothetical protein [Pseudomonas donghuensis]|uniref:hypothetical protein n=1 Tax=Pseudomonas donghuensis TaxID=1163398 RepID=UPI001672842B|nr:hypothetical protein [Pseudomonas donghuensis]WKY26995.1 hypothetical protein QYF67_19190 [Pseudomonas donghuensis]